MFFEEEKACLVTCPHLLNRSQGCFAAIKHNALRVVCHITDEENGFELARMRNS